MGRQMNKMKTILYGMANRPYIPEYLTGKKQRFILHISDTPVEIYRFIYRVIEAVRPVDIIHTGDAADNYKIEFQDYYRENYREAVTDFFKTMNSISGANIHMTMGNHDDEAILRDILPDQPLKDRFLQLHGKPFYIMHEMDDPPAQPGFYCFGHKFEPVHEENENYTLLNGILNINVIDIHDWHVYHLEYPPGTNGYRKMTNGRIRL